MFFWIFSIFIFTGFLKCCDTEKARFSESTVSRPLSGDGSTEGTDFTIWISRTGWTVGRLHQRLMSMHMLGEKGPGIWRVLICVIVSYDLDSLQLHPTYNFHPWLFIHDSTSRATLGFPRLCSILIMFPHIHSYIPSVSLSSRNLWSYISRRLLCLNFPSSVIFTCLRL